MGAPPPSGPNLETYYGPITAIRGVSFDVTEGQIVTILGANGAGKTTVLKSVCGAMEPQKGTVSFGGRGIIGRDLDIVYSYFPILRERQGSQAGFLSGGQQQMLAIGRALMARPKL